MLQQNDTPATQFGTSDGRFSGGIVLCLRHHLTPAGTSLVLLWEQTGMDPVNTQRQTDKKGQQETASRKVLFENTKS